MKWTLKNKINKDLWVQQKSNFFLLSFTRALKYYAIFLSAVKPACMLHQKAEVRNILFLLYILIFLIK